MLGQQTPGKVAPQKQSDPAGGIPAGSLEVKDLGGLGRLEIQRGVSLGFVVDDSYRD